MSDQYIGYTLVDITATGVVRSKTYGDKARNQQRNWETVVQLMGLRTQPSVIGEPKCTLTDIGNDMFGEMYTGQQAVWIWQFRVEHPSALSIDGDPLGALNNDFEKIPVITGLDETAKFILPIFHPYGAIKNIHFRLA
jgi:hypothetical protein